MCSQLCCKAQSIGTGSVNDSTTKGHRIPIKHSKSNGKDSMAASALSKANCGLVTAEYYELLERQRTKYTIDTIVLVHQCQEVI
jgi:hypothetical protein